MKPSKYWLLAGLLVWASFGIAATTRYLDRKNLLIENFNSDEVKLMIRTVSPTTNLIEVLDDTTTKFAVPSTGVIAVDYGGTGAATVSGARTALGVGAATSGTYTNIGIYGAQITGSFTNVGLTASLPVFTDANKVLSSVTVANAKLALGIDAGAATAAADGAKTNTFNLTFSSVPRVVVTETGAAAATLNIVITNVTTTNFITLGDASGTYNWIAVGAP